METKKLYRSNKSKIIAGVFGGIGEYLNIDPVIFRLILVLLFIFTGVISGFIASSISSLVIYFLAVIIIPKKYE